MKILLIIALIVAVGLFIWQGVLFALDIVKKVKAKKKKTTASADVDNQSTDVVDRKE